MLALCGQILTGRFIDIRPVDAGLAQAAKLDHFLINRLIGFVLDIEIPGGLFRFNRRQQQRDNIGRYLDHQRHA